MLLESKPQGLERCLTLSLASLILLLAANVFPLLGMNIEGRVQQSTIVSGVFELYRQGFGAMAALVFGVSGQAPARKILALLLKDKLAGSEFGRLQAGPKGKTQGGILQQYLARGARPAFK